MNMKGSRLVTTIFGILLLSTGLFMMLVKSWLLKLMLPTFTLEPHTMLEEFWRNPPLDIITDFYIFNWTNPEDIRNKSIKPSFEEVGPYRFIQNTKKLNIVWNANHTVTYQQKRTWRFDKRHTKSNLSDTFSTINLMTLCTAHILRYWNFFSKFAASNTISTVSPDINVTITAHQIAIEGYDKLLADLFLNFAFLTPELHRLKEFGLMSARNESLEYDGVFNIATGSDGNFELLSWNYNNKTTAYEGACSNINGTAGELYGPIKSRDNLLRVFNIEACRQLLMEYAEDVTIGGILGYKYSPGDKILDNGTRIPENKCYCAGECIPSGVLNVSSCMFGFPLLLSLPHFYLADPMYYNSVEGLQPEKDKHETYVIVEPQTGIPLKAVLRVQLSALLHPIKDFSVFQDAPVVYFPLCWFDIEVHLPDRLAFVLKIFLWFPSIYSTISNTLTAIGICILTIIIIYRYCTIKLFKNVYKSEREESPHAEEMPLRCEKQRISK